MARQIEELLLLTCLPSLRGWLDIRPDCGRPQEPPVAPAGRPGASACPRHGYVRPHGRNRDGLLRSSRLYSLTVEGEPFCATLHLAAGLLTRK
jgi:hypothetical protein